MNINPIANSIIELVSSVNKNSIVTLISNVNKVRLAYGTVDCIKRFSLGAAIAGIITPLTVGVVKVAQMVGVVPNLDNEIHKLKPMVEKYYMRALIGVVAPIVEEFFFRGWIQDIFLTQMAKHVVKEIHPGNETLLDTKIAKAFRIILTSGLFSAAHMNNDRTFPNSYVKAQLIATFIGGIGLGVLKESKNYGLLSAMGAHIANNVAAIAYTLYS